MSHPELLLQKLGKTGVQGDPCTLVKGWPPLTIPLGKANYKMFAILLRRAISS